MQEKIDKIRSILYVNGKCASMRLSRSYFCKLGLSHLWDWVYEETKNIPEDIKFVERLYLIEKGITAPGTCKVCGKPTKFARDIHDYQRWCSKQCQFKDEEFIETKREVWRKFSDEKLADIQKRREDTYLERYGVKYTLQHPDKSKGARESFRNKNVSKESQDLLDNKEWLNEKYHIEGLTSTQIAEILKLKHYGTVIEHMRRHGIDIKQSYNRSAAEKEIEIFVSQYTDVVSTYKEDKMEIDILVPEYDFGIEYNGLYWHSYSSLETTEERQKHLKKKEHFAEIGIEIINIDSYSWETKKDIWKSYIRNRLGLNKKIYARKCEIREVSSSLSNEFLNNNHLQGSVKSSIRLGLYYKNNLVSLMTFGTPRFNSNYSWEMLRFCCALNTSVVGGFSKLLKHFIRNNSGNIISYADYSRSNGEIYIKNGFKLVNKTSPGYLWIEGGEIPHHRTKFMKHMLSEKLNIFDQSKTEAENMFVNGYRRYWDCGQLVFGLE